MVWEMAPLVKCLSHKYKGLTLILRTQVYKVRSPASVGGFRGERGNPWDLLALQPSLVGELQGQ